MIKLDFVRFHSDSYRLSFWYLSNLSLRMNRESWNLWLHVPFSSPKVATLQNLRLNSWLSMCFAVFKYALPNIPGIFSSNPCFCALNKALNNVQVLNGYSEEFRYSPVILMLSTWIKALDARHREFMTLNLALIPIQIKQFVFSLLSRLGNKEILSYQTFGCVYRSKSYCKLF